MLRFQHLAGIAALSILAGCSLWSEDAAPPTAALVVGDEPYAVRAGASILARGGSAADAAAATYFALAVTYPVAAGIGGGGLCIVHDPARAANEQITFLARDAAHPGAYAVPGSVKGVALLQSLYGKLPWQRVVAAGEGYAATGFPISHALSVRLSENQDIIRLDAGLASEFLDETGHVKPEGSIVTSLVLAQTLSAIRQAGPAGLYEGRVADGIVAYSGAEGGAITARELAAYAAGRGVATREMVGTQTVYLPSSKVGAGAFISAMLSHLVDAQGAIGSGSNLAASVASATKITLDQFGLAKLPRDLGATAFAATDNDGQAVACAVTMNGPFGSGHTATGTGVTLARAPSSGDAGLAAAFLTPAIVVGGTNLTLAGAGAGGPNGTAALVYAVLKLAEGIDVMEPGQLHSTGIAPYDTVNTIVCSGSACVAIPDPGANGLGAAG